MRKAFCILALLLASTLAAQEDFLRLPPDSTGKRLRMRTSTQGANFVYSQAFFMDDGSGGGPLGVVGNPIFVTFTNAAIAATQSGSWTVNVSNFPATQPVSASSLPLPSGASTEATLALIKAKTDNIDVALSTRTKPADQQHVIVDSAPTTAVTGPLTDTQLRATPVPVSGTVTANVGTGTQPVSGTFWQATQPVSGTFWQATQPVSGTVTANVGTTNGLALDATLTGGTQKTKIVDTGGTNVATVSAAGALKVDGSAVTQPVSGTVTTTPPANASTNIAQMNGTTVSMNTGVRDAGTQRVTIATNDVVPISGSISNTGFNVNNIPHVITDTGSTTAVTGNVTVTQATGTNLHAVLDTTSTTAVTQATGTNLHAVIDSGSTTAVTGNVTVVQGTGSNLHVAVDSAPTTAVTGTFFQATQPVSITAGNFPDNEPINVAQLAGTAADTNSGVKSAGTLRVVLATDQPQLTNKLLVTPDANALVAQGTAAATTAPWPQAAGTVTPVTATWTSATGVNTALSLVVTGMGSVAIVNNPTTITGGVLTPEVSDATQPTVWIPAPATPTTTINPIPSLTIGPTALGGYTVPVAGWTNFRLRLSTVLTGAGSDVISIQASAMPRDPYTAITNAASTLGVNVSALNGAAIVTGGVAGTLGVGGTQANNAAINANPMLKGAEAVAMGANPTAATAGNIIRDRSNIEGTSFVQLGGANQFSCFLQAVTVTTQCQAAPAAGLRAYVTGVHFSNQAATVQTLDIVYGTGAACVTSPVALTHKWQMGTNATTTSPQSIDAVFNNPLVPVAANAICVRPSAATAFGATLTGFIAP